MKGQDDNSKYQISKWLSYIHFIDLGLREWNQERESGTAVKQGPGGD